MNDLENILPTSKGHGLPTDPPKKRKYTRHKPVKKAKKAEEKDAPIYGGDAGELAGISATRCPDACTAGRCVISTVDVCKHPLKSGDGGCGPITMANRSKAKKLIKHQLIEIQE